MYAFIVVDAQGRAYHPILGGDIARYDPRTEQLDRLTQTIDGAAPTDDSRLADPKSHPINWEVSPDRPAALAGLEGGDLILAVDGEEVGSFPSGNFGFYTFSQQSGRFTLVDPETQETMRVRYEGLKPANFEDAISIVAIGRYDASTEEMAADKLRAKIIGTAAEHRDPHAWAVDVIDRSQR